MDALLVCKNNVAGNNVAGNIYLLLIQASVSIE